MCLRNERTKGLTKPEIGVKLVLQALRPLGYIGTWEPEDDETKGLKNMCIICAPHDRRHGKILRFMPHVVERLGKLETP